jgi:hypothetical protein
MSSNKKSFLLHVDSLDILDELTDEECGLLFKAIRAHQLGDDIELSGLVRVAFSPFRNQFTRDDEKYSLTCERRAQAGSKGGKQKVANASKSKQKLANVAESVNDNKNDSDSDSDNKIDKKNIAQALNYDNWESKPSDDVLNEWLSNRKKKKLAVSQLVITKTGKEINAAFKLGYSADDCLSEAIIRGWQGIKADWMQNSGVKKTALHDVSNKEYYSGDL